MLESHDEMLRVFPHFVGRDFRFEIKRPKRAVTASFRIQLWVQIKNALARKIDNPQVGVT